MSKLIISEPMAIRGRRPKEKFPKGRSLLNFIFMKNTVAEWQYRVKHREPFHSLAASMCRYGVLAFAILIFAGAASAQTPCEYSTAKGTVNDPYEISTVCQFQALTSTPTGFYSLVDDIDADGTDFAPIGGTVGFSGTFNGNRKSISNLTINRPSSSRVGLFGKLNSGGKILNLNLVNVDVTGLDYVGALVGQSLGNIEKSSVTGTVTGRDLVGGLVGESRGNIEEVSVTGTVAGRHQVGGLVGISRNANLSDCKSDVVVRPITRSAANNAAEYLGGLVGQLSGTTVIRCSATGDLVLPENGKSQTNLNQTVRIVGGLIGHAESSTVQNSFATGQIDAGADTAGGLIGRAINAMISETYASGAVYTLRSAGGLIGILGVGSDSGRRSAVLNSYSTGDVNLRLNEQIRFKRLGGLIGELQETWLVSGSYATGNNDNEARNVIFGSLLGAAFGIGVVENSFATGSAQRQFIRFVQSSTKVTSSGNYFIESPDIQSTEQGVTRIKLSQLKCPTSADEACDGSIAPFRNWDPYFWNFGTSAQLPTLTGAPRANRPSDCIQIDKNYAVGEDGSINNPYNIDTICRLQAIQENLTAHYKLAANLDATDAGSWNNGAGFTPIGGGGAGFSGTFDGNGMSISNLTINRASSRVGLFRNLDSGGEIRDLSLVNLNVIGVTIVGGLVGESRGLIVGGRVSGFVGKKLTATVVGPLVGTVVGGLVGRLHSGGEIRDTNMENMNVSGATIVGGMVGDSGGSIDGAGTLNGSVAGRYRVGGLVGLSSAGGEIRNVSLVNVQVAESSRAIGQGQLIGGLAGESNGVISDSTVTGSVSGTNVVGGLVGVGKGSRGNISRVSVEGSVSGVSSVGGLAGRFGDSDIRFRNGTLSDCESSATVHPRLSATGQGAEYLGGLVGHLSRATVSRCSATGDLVLSSERSQRRLAQLNRIVGGLIGLADRSVVKNSYASGQINAMADIAGGLIGIAVESMVSESYASGAVSATQKAGGLIGWLGSDSGAGFRVRTSRVLNSYSTGDVGGSVNVVRAGGLIGQLEEIWVISNSYATGNVEPQGVKFGSLLGYAFGTGLVENSFATGSPESGFIYQVNGSATLTLNENYYTGTMAPSGVTTQVALAQLQCPTTPGDVCDGISPFENWNPNIWDFGTDAELPTLIPIPVVQITVGFPMEGRNVLGFTLGTTHIPLSREVKVMLNPAPDSNNVLRVALTKTSGTVRLCSSVSDTGCVFLKIGNRRTNTVHVPRGTDEAILTLSLEIGIEGEIARGQTGKFMLVVQLPGYPYTVSGNNVLLEFHQGGATMQPVPDSASVQIRVFLGGAVR